MTQQESGKHSSAMRKPTRGDRLVVLLFSLPFPLLIFPGERLLQGQAWVWVVMGAIIGVPVVTIDVLFSFSQWKIPPSVFRSCASDLARFLASLDCSKRERF